MSVYGYCSICGAEIVNRTRGIPCKDRCANGHFNLASLTLAAPFTPKSSEEQIVANITAGWGACRTSVYSICERMRDTALDAVKEGKDMTEYADGFQHGLAYAAKHIARYFGSINAEHDEHIQALLSKEASGI